MNQQKGNRCPECDALRGPDHTPSCGCGQQAAEALRDARTADAAAAGDFDPLRIRPYVELETPGEETPPAEADATMTLRAVGAPAADGTAAQAPDATMALRTVTVPPGAPSLRPAGAMPPLAPVPAEPKAADLVLFTGPDTAQDRTGPPVAGDGDGAPRRPRRALLIGAGVAVAAVAVGAAFAGGLFSYSTPSHDGAPQEVRAAVPEVSESAAPAAASVAASAIAPVTSAPVPSVTASASTAPASPSPSPSATHSTQAATPSASVRAEHTRSPAHDRGDNDGSATLRRGDRGSDVVELQERLHQLSLYLGQDDGVYSTQVEAAVTTYQWARGLRDDLGVYDAKTRASLEAETSQP
ncbi:peptidoglycan-binding protein [Streptomyces sp. NPDC090306]|uniref:peptidoglycan-binding domain-containing protein n=1 Tax=Streptomyces sp. NPDC090306 TaxID=3365961 RepID=UPI00381F673C